MSDKLFDDLEALVVVGAKRQLVDENAIGRINLLVSELKQTHNMGMPAFTIAPTPGFCSACGQEIKAQKKMGKLTGKL